MVDSIYRTRSLGVAAEGLPDQYADGKAAKVWEYYIGHKQERTNAYRNWLVKTLKDRNCHTILDVACGTGVDSILLLEEGFDVTSTDASDKMLKYAIKERWNRRKEPQFDKWVIEEANWLSLGDDLDDEGIGQNGFDAVICLGNSFAHLPDFQGNQENHKQALGHFASMVKPGGILLIDHRNYDTILDTGSVPAKNIYYNSAHIVEIKCSNLYVNSKASMVTLDYVMDMSSVTSGLVNGKASSKKLKLDNPNCHHHFRLSYYPHKLSGFKSLLAEVFGRKSKHDIFADFKPVGEIDKPAYYIHVVEKS